MIRFNSSEPKNHVISKSYLLRSTKPYEDIYVSIDKTKAEQAKHKLLVEELKSRRANGETNIVIRGDSIIIKPTFRKQPSSSTIPMTTNEQSG